MTGKFTEANWNLLKNFIDWSHPTIPHTPKDTQHSPHDPTYTKLWEMGVRGPYFRGSFFTRTFFPHGENIMEIFSILSVVIWFSTGTLRIFATLVYVFTMRVVIYDILSMAIIPTLSTSILFCNLCYILLLISPRSVVKIAIWI